MANPAKNVAPQDSAAIRHYEQPLSERMRTFLRLEFLYQQMLYNSEREADWATRATIGSLLDILAILSRGDVRSDVHKELDHQLGILQRFQSQPGVDSGRLDTLIHNLSVSKEELSRIGTSFLQPLKDSDFLNAIKHRSAIPGGTCEFDLQFRNVHRWREVGRVDGDRPLVGDLGAGITWGHHKICLSHQPVGHVDRMHLASEDGRGRSIDQPFQPPFHLSSESHVWIVWVRSRLGGRSLVGPVSSRGIQHPW